MKLFITGIPESGKSTLTQSLIASYPRKQGFITREMRDNGDRAGFEIVTASGILQTLAHVDIVGPPKVSRYGVDVAGFAALLPAIEKFSDADLLYIDEIGQMELYADAFAGFVDRYLAAPNLFIGTISKVFADDNTRRWLRRPDIQLVDIDALGRDGAKAKALSILSKS